MPTSPGVHLSHVEIGGLCEQLAAYKLSRQGFKAHLVSDKSYDIIIDVDGDLKKVQVKGTSHKKSKGDNHFYNFNTSWGSKVKNKYEGIDFFALVALDIECVYYIKAGENGKTKRIDVKDMTRENEYKTLKEVLEL